jgi:hypothetical protein
MESMGWILTIGGGIIVGLVVLIIEYGYFKNRRDDRPNEETFGGNNISQLWSKAIDNALQSFSKNYPNSELKIVEMRIKRGLLKKRALVAIRVERLGDTNFFYLEVDKSGDVLRIASNRFEVFGLQ